MNHEIFIKIDHILGHQTQFNQFKRIQTMYLNLNEINLYSQKLT